MLHTMKSGELVRVETGQAIYRDGTVFDIAYDGWVGVQLDGERRIDLWHPRQITRLCSAKRLQFIPTLRGVL